MLIIFEACNFAHFLHLYDMHKLSTTPKLWNCTLQRENNNKTGLFSTTKVISAKQFNKIMRKQDV